MFFFFVIRKEILLIAEEIVRNLETTQGRTHVNQSLFCFSLVEYNLSGRRNNKNILFFGCLWMRRIWLESNYLHELLWRRLLIGSEVEFFAYLFGRLILDDLDKIIMIVLIFGIENRWSTDFLHLLKEFSKRGSFLKFFFLHYE